MSERTRVYITMPERSLVRSTDRAYLYDRLTQLEQRYPLAFVANARFMSRFANDLDHLRQRLFGLVGHVPAPGVEDVFAHVPFPRDIDVAYAYGMFPRAPPRRVPITWQQTFAPASLGIDLPAWRAATRKARCNAVARADRIVVPSAVSLAHLHDLFPAARERASILPYYLPGLEPLAADALAAKSGPGPLRVVFVGKQARRKGLPALVAAWQLLDTRTKNAIDVTVVSAMVDGEVPFPPTWHGTRFIPDLYALLGTAHVLVFPSLREAYGLVLVEAMACGLAVITTTAPTQRDIVSDAGGRFLPPTDPHALAATLSELVADRAAVAAMATANVRRFRASLWHEVVGPAHVAAFTYP